jgi:hypothetical protein
MNILDKLTIISFLISVYAVYIGLDNLKENREQSKSQQDLLNYLEFHLQNQDDLLRKVVN